MLEQWTAGNRSEKLMSMALLLALGQEMGHLAEVVFFRKKEICETEEEERN